MLAKSKSEQTPKRSAKRDAILDEGARLMNSDGAGSIRLGEIAKTLGLSRNALYYYVKDRSDLVRQCYERACETIEDNLSRVSNLPESPTEKIKALIQRTLLPDHPHRAALVDIAILDKPYRELIRARQKRHVEALAGILYEGQETGVFKSFNAAIAAHAIFGMLDWVLLWVQWVSEGTTCNHKKLAIYSKALTDCVLNGFISERAFNFVCPFDYISIAQQPFNVFDKSDANRIRREQLIQAASVVFNRMGLDGASVDTIAEQVGATKGAIYHHFQDKTALIDGCYSQAFNIYELISDIAHEADVSAAEKLLIDFHLNCQAQASHSPPLILQPGIMRLPEEYLIRSKALAEQMLNTFKSAQQKGQIRKGSPLLVEVTPGAFFWIQKWQNEYSPVISSVDLANELTLIVGAGILVKDKNGFEL